MTKRFSGWHMTVILLAFFGVVVAVNLTMATLATRTFGGVVVANSYVASQKYNAWLAAARRQDQLGWKVAPRLDGGRPVVVGVSASGVAVSGFARHPLGRAADVPLTFDSAMRSRQALPPGRWALHLLVRKGADEARFVEQLQ